MKIGSCRGVGDGERGKGETFCHLSGTVVVDRAGHLEVPLFNRTFSF